MYFQFLIEDQSTEILVGHVMEKLKEKYPEKEILYDSKPFKGIGHLPTKGNLMERKGGNLLNNLHIYLRGFDKKLAGMEHATIVVVLDNDKRDYNIFQQNLNQVAKDVVMLTDYAFCIAVKEMEAWLLGDEDAIYGAYPEAKKKFLKNYKQDEIVDTWEVLANMVYPGELAKLHKVSKNSYKETGKAKCEWADKIGQKLVLEKNVSPSFQKFLFELCSRIEAA
ncbi:hypothetical protein [Roseburia faecis]|uniref:hypothetical protein n=1 Tax=Roseburia faecis TaxID=301302 RepID=UPI003F9C7850